MSTRPNTRDQSEKGYELKKLTQNSYKMSTWSTQPSTKYSPSYKNCISSFLGLLTETQNQALPL